MNDNPTPATREREAAEELSWKLYEILSDEGAVIGNASVSIMSPLIAAALARERREALTESAQVARAMYADNHNLRGHGVIFAESIAKAIEALRE